MKKNAIFRNSSKKTPTKTPIFEIHQKKRPQKRQKERHLYEDINKKKETIQKTLKKNATKKTPRSQNLKNEKKKRPN